MPRSPRMLVPGVPGVLVLMVAAALGASCMEKKADLGETCGGFVPEPVGCLSGLACCQPDPRHPNIPGTCIKRSHLVAEGEPCGVTAGTCCASGTYCEVLDQESGDGTCVPDPTCGGFKVPVGSGTITP